MHQALHFLIWCTAINYAILIVWFVVFTFAHEWLYRMHTRWFKLPVETFDSIHYGGIALYKIGILLLNLVPLIAIHFV
jgi:hypothetical protein